MPTLYKAVTQRHMPAPATWEMFSTFRSMVNDCLRLGPDDGATYEVMKKLCYPRMLDYEVPNTYRASAMFEKTDFLKKYHSDSAKGASKRPRCTNSFLAASVGGAQKGTDGRSTE